MAADKVEKEDVGEGDKGSGENAIPHGATYLAGLHDKTKNLHRHMLTKGLMHHDKPHIKSLHTKMCKAMEGHLDDIRGTFEKTYPDIEGLEKEGDEEGEEEGETQEEKEHERAEGVEDEKALPSSDIDPEKARKILKDGTVRGHELTSKQRGMFGAAAGRGKSLRVKSTAATLPDTALGTVKSAAALLEELAAGANLTAAQKAAILHTSGRLAEAATVPEAPPEVSSEEEAHLKALIAAAAKRVEANQTLLSQALGK